MNKTIKLSSLIGKANKAYIERAHGKENHAPRGIVAEHSIASPRLLAHQRATLKEQHYLQNEQIKLTKEIARFETRLLFAYWAIAALAGFVVVGGLVVAFGL